MNEDKDALIYLADVRIDELEAENAKLREQLERVQPTDCEGNALDVVGGNHCMPVCRSGIRPWKRFLLRRKHEDRDCHSVCL